VRWTRYSIYRFNAHDLYCVALSCFVSLFLQLSNPWPVKIQVIVDRFRWLFSSLLGTSKTERSVLFVCIQKTVAESHLSLAVDVLFACRQRCHVANRLTFNYTENSHFSLVNRRNNNSAPYFIEPSARRLMLSLQDTVAPPLGVTVADVTCMACQHMEVVCRSMRKEWKHYYHSWVFHYLSSAAAFISWIGNIDGRTSCL